jgi:DivIVA domain-containing protein
MEQVDAFLDAVRDTLLGVRHPPLTADEIRDKRFATTRLRPGYDEEEVDAFLGEAEARLRVRCAECRAETTGTTEFCTLCGAPAVGQPPVAADPLEGGLGASAAIAAAGHARSGPARGRRWYLLMFLACCLILPISLFVGVKAPNNSALAAWMGVTCAASLFGAIGFLIAFVFTLSQWRRRRVRQVAWAGLPILSFSLLAWWPFLVIALIRLRARDWAVFAAYLAALVGEIAFLILGAQGVIPAEGGAITFLWLVLVVAVTAAVHTFVAFRPGAELPSLSDVSAARAAAKRHPVRDAAGSESWQ